MWVDVFMDLEQKKCSHYSNLEAATILVINTKLSKFLQNKNRSEFSVVGLIL